MIEFGVLGPLRVRSEAGEINVAGVRRRALLIRLLASANLSVPSVRLTEDIWEGEPPPGATSTLASHISLLRKLLGPDRIRGGGGSYMLEVGADELDARQFATGAREGREALTRGTADEAVELLERALGRWRGPALDDVAGADWARPESVRLEELRLGAMEALLDARLTLGQNDEVTAAAEAAVALHPLHEQLWGQLMIALYRSGRQAEALRAFQRLRRSLGEELGLEPSERLVKLEQAIALQELDLTPARAGAYSHARVGSATAAVPTLPPALAVQAPVPCVGREPELRLLAKVWSESVSGSRRTIFIGGEPGVGKTRLVSEFGRSVHAEGGTVLYGRCDEDLEVSYQPFALALRHYIAEGGGAGFGDRQPDLTRILPELGLRTSPAPLPAADPGIERWRLFEDVAKWLDSASARRPLLLILEDLNWAAVPSVLLLRHLVRDKAPASLLIVGTFRDTELERGQPLASMMADLRPEDGVSRVSLKGLDKEGVFAYLEASAGVGLDDQGRLLAAFLYEDASGNPLFIGEALRHLTETGAVTTTNGSWTFDGPLPSIDIPPSVRDVIDRRIARLSSSAHHALSVAACCGLEFELGLIEAVLPDGDWVLQDLDRAVGTEIIEELPGVGHYAFSHSLVRRALYEQLSVTRRSRTHGQLGSAIERIHADDLAPFFASLCSHFAKAEDPESKAKAARYSLAAAQRSLNQLAAEEALNETTIGLGLLALEPRPNRTLRADLHLARAQALLFSGDIAGSKRAAAAAADDARAIRSAGRMIAAAAARGWHPSPGDSDPMVPELCTEALDMTRSTDVELRAKGLATLALYKAVNEGKATEADPLAAESVELARSLQSPHHLWETLYARSHTLWPSKRIDERVSISEEMVGLSERIEEIEPRHQSLFFRGVVRLENADRAGFEADLAVVTQLAIDSRGYWVPMAVTDLWRTLLFLLDGRIEEAEACAVAGFGAVPHSDVIFRTSFTAQLFAIRREQGRLRELIPGFEATPRMPPLAAVQAGLALAHAEVGDFESAVKFLGDLVADDFSALRHDSTWTIQLADLADVVDLSGASEHADSVYKLLAPRSGQVVVASLGCFCAGAADRYLGMMADLSGNHDLAARHFEEALRLETRIGSEPLVARTKASYARMLFHREDDRSRHFARELLDESLTVSRRLGLIALERRSTSLQDELAS